MNLSDRQIIILIEKLKKFAKTSLKVKILGCDYLLVQWCVKLTLSCVMSIASKHFHMQLSAKFQVPVIFQF